ncbi:hypothetical protein C4Z32_009575, partial [Klebsiella pneumoniae subsp. pneumoniae]
SAQIREILISESAWEEMTCLFAPSLDKGIPRSGCCVKSYPVCYFSNNSAVSLFVTRQLI